MPIHIDILCNIALKKKIRNWNYSFFLRILYQYCGRRNLVSVYEIRGLCQNQCTMCKPLFYHLLLIIVGSLLKCWILVRIFIVLINGHKIMITGHLVLYYIFLIVVQSSELIQHKCCFYADIVNVNLTIVWRFNYLSLQISDRVIYIFKSGKSDLDFCIIKNNYSISV